MPEQNPFAVIHKYLSARRPELVSEFVSLVREQGGRTNGRQIVLDWARSQIRKPESRAGAPAPHQDPRDSGVEIGAENRGNEAENFPAILTPISRDSGVEIFKPEKHAKPAGNKAETTKAHPAKTGVKGFETTREAVIGDPSPQPDTTSKASSKEPPASRKSKSKRPRSTDLTKDQVQHLGMARNAWRHNGRPLNVSITHTLESLKAYREIADGRGPAKNMTRKKRLDAARRAGVAALTQHRRDMRRLGFPMTFVGVYEVSAGRGLHTHEGHHFETTQDVRAYIPHVLKLYDLGDLDLDRLRSDRDYQERMHKLKRIPIRIEGRNHQCFLKHDAALKRPADAGYTLSYMAKSAPDRMKARIAGRVFALSTVRAAAIDSGSKSIRAYEKQSEELTIKKRVFSSADMTRPALLRLGIKPEDAGWIETTERARRDSAIPETSGKWKESPSRKVLVRTDEQNNRPLGYDIINLPREMA